MAHRRDVGLRLNRYTTFESAVPSVALGVGLLMSPLPSYALFYHAEAIEGWVVDAQTERPIEGVVVVAHWQLQGGGEGGTALDELKIFEAVTDPNGRYFFPAWGPKFSLSGLFGSLPSESPGILMFKQGYKFQRLLNQWHPDLDTSKSKWNRKTVKLERFDGMLEEYAQHLSGLSSDLWTAGYGVGDQMGDHCGWKSFPNMLRALDKVDKQTPSRLGYRTVTAQLRGNEQKLRSAGCGTVADLIGE